MTIGKNIWVGEVAVRDTWRPWISYSSFAVQTSVLREYTRSETLTHLRIDCPVIISTMVYHLCGCWLVGHSAVTPWMCEMRSLNM